MLSASIMYQEQVCNLCGNIFTKRSGDPIFRCAICHSANRNVLPQIQQSTDSNNTTVDRAFFKIFMIPIVLFGIIPFLGVFPFLVGLLFNIHLLLHIGGTMIGIPFSTLYFFTFSMIEISKDNWAGVWDHATIAWNWLIHCRICK